MGQGRVSKYPDHIDGRTVPKPDYARRLASLEAIEARRRDWKSTVLREYAACGNVTKACKRANVDPKLFYKARREDEEFAEAFALAHRAATDKALEAVWEIGVEGTREPIFWQGEIVGYIRRRDWKAAKYLLETMDPPTYSQRERIARMNVTAAEELTARREEQLALADKRYKEFSAAMKPTALPDIVDAEVEEDDDDDDDS